MGLDGLDELGRKFLGVAKKHLAPLGRELKNPVHTSDYSRSVENKGGA